jgi:hypothetical protein
MGATPATGPTLGTRHPTPMWHIVTVTLGIAEALASTFTLHPQITAIDTADPDISIIGIAASIVVGEVAQSLPTQAAGTAHIAPRDKGHLSSRPVSFRMSPTRKMTAPGRL